MEVRVGNYSGLLFRVDKDRQIKKKRSLEGTKINMNIDFTLLYFD